MKRCKVSFITVVLFVLLQTIMYITFLSLDILGDSITISRNIKFSIIIMCFCFALFQRKSANRGINFCVKAGLFFTVISDLFILMLDYYMYGVLTFIVVQQLYGVRLILAEIEMRDRDVKTRRSLLMNKLIQRIFFEAAIALFVCILLCALGVYLEALLIISVFYFVCIVTNTIKSIIIAVWNPQNKRNVLFAVGMGLFLLCDINVGLFNLSGFISLSQKLYHTVFIMSSILMWFFYAPSQVLIALSIKHNTQ